MIGQRKRRGDLDQICSSPLGGEVLALPPESSQCPVAGAAQGWVGWGPRPRSGGDTQLTAAGGT